jgi:hypothetical protein
MADKSIEGQGLQKILGIPGIPGAEEPRDRTAIETHLVYIDSSPHSEHTEDREHTHPSVRCMGGYGGGRYPRYGLYARHALYARYDVYAVDDSAPRRVYEPSPIDSSTPEQANFRIKCWVVLRFFLNVSATSFG